METNRAIGATIILAGMIVFWATTSIKKRVDRKRKKKIREEGVEANATVLNISPTGEYSNNLPEFQVKMKIQPEGGDQFEAEVREVLPFAKYDAIQQGAQILVKYDRDYYQRVIIFQLAETLA